MFRNFFYCCPCGEQWVDEWSATCDYRCPRCDTSCAPTESEDEVTRTVTERRLVYVEATTGNADDAHDAALSYVKGSRRLVITATLRPAVTRPTSTGVAMTTTFKISSSVAVAESGVV
jgi:hypothetical protein